MSAEAELADASPAPATIRLRAEFEGARVEEVLGTLERELVGLKPVKTRIREIASLLVIEQARRKLALGFEVSSETSAQWEVSMQKAIRLALATAIRLGMAPTASAQA
jgi:hypothetical protein